MGILAREVESRHNGVVLEGVLAYDDAWTARQAGVLVIHGMEGRSQPQVEFGKRIAEWGYAAFAVDLYGKGASAESMERRRERMNDFLADRAGLQVRVHHVVEVVRSLPEVDAGRVAAMGFCFGGLCVLDLARTRAPIRGAASFHGVLTPPGNTAGNRIEAKVIVFHGWDDPFAPPETVVALGHELTLAGADWQIHAYGHTKHSFMARGVYQPELGIEYNEVSAGRATTSFRSFLAETLR